VSGPLFAEFHGERTGVEPLTWGQRSIWDTVARLAPADHFLNVRRVLSLSVRAGVTPAAAASAVGRLMSRHETLRTRVRLVGSEPQQVLAGAGRLAIGSVEAAPDDLDAVAGALRDRLVAPPFDYPREWPLRVGLVTCAGLVRRVALVVSHLSVDGYATDLLLRDLRLLLLRDTVAPVTGRQPLDVARAERERAHVSARALEHWATEYRRLPRTMLARVGEAHDPPYQRVLLTSTALDLAARAVALRHRTSTATVLLAATAAVLGGWTGHGVCALETLVHNRFQEGHADIMGTLVQTGLFVVDVADDPGLDVLVPRTFQAALRAYRNAYYFPPARDRLTEGLGRAPGTPFNPYGCFNDVRLAADGPPAQPAEPAKPAESTLDPQEPPDRMHCRLCVELHDAPRGMGVLLTADTAYLPPDDMRRFLHTLESVVVAAAPASVDGVRRL
jgi:hypothetical protein